jgi:surface carbohydrate biosynthesis protein (TIGR04326 family)
VGYIYVLDEYFESTEKEISVPKLVDDLAPTLKTGISAALDSITSIFFESHSLENNRPESEFYSLISVARLNWSGKNNFNELLKILAIKSHSGESFANLENSLQRAIPFRSATSRAFIRAKNLIYGTTICLESMLWVAWRGISHLALAHSTDFTKHADALFVTYPEDEMAQTSGTFSRFWGSLPKTITSNQLVANWLYLPDHGYSIGALLKARRRTPETTPSNRFAHADAVLRLGDLAKIYAKYLKKLPERLITFRKVEAKLEHSLSFDLLRRDLLHSWIGRPYLESIFYEELFKKIAKYQPAKLVYLFENQTWEKHLNAFSKVESLETIGVNHSTTRFWDLRLTVDATLNPITYLPGSLIANSGASRLDLEAMTQKLNIPVETSFALRYAYLAKRKVGILLDPPKKLLVCFGYNKSVTARLLDTVLSISDTGLKIRLRFHPGVDLPRNLPDLSAIGIEHSNWNLETDLAWCDVVITDSMSSVSFEAMHEGLPALLFRDGTTPNMSPLFLKETIPTFWDRDSLLTSLTGIESLTLAEGLRFELHEEQERLLSIMKTKKPPKK